jgi:phage-related protein
MELTATTTILTDLKKELEELPIEVRKQLIAVLHELRREVENTERKSVSINDRSTQSWFARA